MTEQISESVFKEWKLELQREQMVRERVTDQTDYYKNDDQPVYDERDPYYSNIGGTGVAIKDAISKAVYEKVGILTA